MSAPSDHAHATRTSRQAPIDSLEQLANHVDYSLLDTLEADPEARADGVDVRPRQVRSGHYVPVLPTPIADPVYVAHSQMFFEQLGLAASLAQTTAFKNLFSGDVTQLPSPMRRIGWATGYALSIYGTEYTQQCPFRNGNGYGDGRAVSVVEAVLGGQRWEMQLKGGGRTPYCRGGDGRAVLRSSVREFLAQEHMHALGIPTTRSLCLFMSTSEQVVRPWYSADANGSEPDIMVSNPVAITTRVAPSFLRVGQLELFGRRARDKAHATAHEELASIVKHLIAREYSDDVDTTACFNTQVLQLAEAFRARLIALVAQWLRVGYCQGNFNSDNCAAGGFTLDYGPFGFCERFEPFFQPWTGGGQHFSFFNQPAAAETNFAMFCTALRPLIISDADTLTQLEAIQTGFRPAMQQALADMWAAKLGLSAFDADLFSDLVQLMAQTPVDFTLFFRELSKLPATIDGLREAFYAVPSPALEKHWSNWLLRWRELALAGADQHSVGQSMQEVNPKYIWREWLIVPAYEQAAEGNFALIHELQAVLNQPYAEQSAEVEDKYYRLRPKQYLDAGGVAHYSCSS